MSKEQNSGVFQLENGYWGYRFIVTAMEKTRMLLSPQKKMTSLSQSML